MYKEFEALVMEAQKGSREAKKVILERLNPLIIKSIRRYYNNINDFEDLMQEGKLEILECIENYELDKGAYFLGYVQTMLKFLYLNKHKAKISTSLNTKVGEDGEDELMDLIADDVDIEELIIQEEIMEELHKALETLTKRQKEVVYYFYFKRISMKDIAEHLGISYRTVVNIKVQALEKLRNM